MGRRTLFGELGLLKGKRTANVKAVESTVLLVIPKEAFVNYVQKAYLVKVAEIFEFYSRLPFLDSLNDKAKFMLATRSYQKLLKLNTVIALQGQKCGKVHFLSSGRVNVVRELCLDKHPSKKL
jgi:CRP-like cAMP-binding protein